MKELWTDGKSTLVIADANNYAVGKLTESKKDGELTGAKHLQGASYFNNLDSAVKHIARNYADEKCTNLNDWLVCYQSCITKFNEAK